MSAASGRWDDLAARILTGTALAGAGGFAVWAGGWWFLGLCLFAGGAMIWELSRMTGFRTGPVAVLLGAAGALVLLMVSLLPQSVTIAALVLVAVTVGFAARSWRLATGLYAGAILLATAFLFNLREEAGLAWVVWLIGVVVASDIAGYAAGRAIGGPKFWPRISPKKTWSGTIAGWIAAAALGAFMAPLLEAGTALIWLSVAIAFAGQLGDIAESALKRRAGVKDSSGLLPGHGGVLDRFDALLGAALALMLLQAAGGLAG